MRVVTYALRGNDRASHIALAMQKGLQRHGVQALIRRDFTRGVEGDIAIAYGWNHEKIFNAYGKFLYFDMGYWGRKPMPRPREGHHRLAVNSWCTSDFMSRGHGVNRLNASGIVARPTPWGNTVMVTGMSDKAARSHGFEPGQWERQMVETLKGLTTLPVVFRPKPVGCEPRIPIEQALLDCRCLVTHHSNCSVDALIAGVAVYAVKGVGRLFSIDLADINDPPRVAYPSRVQLLSDIAHAQWAPDEMRSGECWDYVNRILQNEP